MTGWYFALFCISAQVFTCRFCYDIWQKFIKLKKEHEELLQKKQNDILEDLEFATTDQLFNELRHRSGKPFVLLSPIANDDQEGLNIEVHSIAPIPCLQILSLAANLTYKELKYRGINVPEIDVLPPYFGMPKVDDDNEDDDEQWSSSSNWI